MRIYKRIIIDIASGRTLSADYSEYYGPIAQCGGSKTTVQATPVTQEEKDLTKAQKEIIELQSALIKEQTRQQDLLAPILFSQAGIETIFDDEGEIIGFKEDPERKALNDQILKEGLQLQKDQLELGRQQINLLISQGADQEEIQAAQLELQKTQIELGQQQLELNLKLFPQQEALQRSQLELAELGIQVTKQELERAALDEAQFGPQRRSIEKLLLDRSEAALKGELPLSPQLIREREEQRTLLQEELRRQLGPGFETSTPGIEALANFDQRTEEIFESTRRGDIRDIEALSLARETSNARTFGETFDSSSPFFGGINAAQAPFFGGIQTTNPQASFAPIFRPGVEQFTNVQAGFGSIAGSLQQDRFAQDQINIRNAQNQSNLFGSIFQGVGSLIGTAVGIGLKCWIAELLYGRNSNAFRAARYWIMFGWEGRLAKACRWTYLRFGERIAGFLIRRPVFQGPARVIFNIAVRKGTECFNG